MSKVRYNPKVWVAKIGILCAILSINSTIVLCPKFFTSDPVFLNAAWAVSGALLAIYFIVGAVETCFKEMDEYYKGLD